VVRVVIAELAANGVKVWRSAFRVWRSAFGVQRARLSILAPLSGRIFEWQAPRVETLAKPFCPFGAQSIRRPLDGFDNHLSERRTVNRERRTVNAEREKRIDDCVPQPILAVL
jgi:hypothetical protein